MREYMEGREREMEEWRQLKKIDNKEKRLRNVW